MTTALFKEAVAEAKPRRFGLLALFFGISVLTLAVGGWLTMLGMGDWYDQLKIPSWQPPGWVFTPAWTGILGLLAVATWLVAREGLQRHGVAFALFLYGAQLLLNVGWSLLFFTLHSPALALLEIIVLLGVLIGMIVTYGRISRLAAWLISPYVAWVCFATAINIWMVLNN